MVFCKVIGSNNKIKMTIFKLCNKDNLLRPKNGRDGTRLIPPRQVSLKLNYYNKNAKNLLSTYSIPQNLVVTCTGL